MIKLNTTSLVAVHLASVQVGGKVLGDVATGGGGITLLPPSIPEEPEPPVEPEVKTYVLTASVINGAISATLNGSAISLPYEANEGDVIVVSVEPNDGFSFEGWLDGNTDNPRSITMNADVVLSAECIAVPSESKYIQFEDAEVERILMSKGVSSDGVGITKEDAERVTSISTWFQNNTTIETFEEFEHFTSVKGLSRQAFYKCTSLRNIAIPSSVVINASDYSIFHGCSSLERVTFKGEVTTIGNEMFAGCSALSEINIPNAVTQIGNSAFNGCVKLAKHLVLPNLLYLGNKVFYNSGLLSISMPSLQTAQYDLFVGSSSLQKIDIGASAVSWNGSAFAGCSALTTVICRATTPPTSGNNIIANSPNAIIYVPDASVEAYRTATNWNQFSSRIKGLSEYAG